MTTGSTIVFLGFWYRVWRDERLTVGSIVSRLNENSGVLDESLPTSLVDAWAETAGGKPGSFKRRLGKALAKHTDTIYGPYRLENAGKDTGTKLTLWRVLLVDDPGVSDFPEFHSSEPEAVFDEEFSYRAGETDSGNSETPNDDETLCARCGVEPVALPGLECDACMEPDR